MMSRQRLTISTACSILLLMAGVLVFSGKPANSFYQKSDSARLEYKTDIVDASSLQLHLDQLGKNGWNVFSVTRSELQLEPAGGGQTKLISTKYQVTAKRTAR